MDGDQITYILLAFIFGVVLSQWYLVVNHPEAVLSGDHATLIEKFSSVAKVKNIHGNLLASIEMGDSKIDTKLSRYSDRCVQMRWHNEYNSVSESVKHGIRSGNWYGGPQIYSAHWPIQRQEVLYQQYLSDDFRNGPEKLGSIVERYWLSSKGVAIYVPFDDPDFYYGVHDGAIQLGSNTNLLYVICSAGSAKDTHEYMISRFIGKPEKLPDEEILTLPIWSTYAKYKTHVNQSAILDFAKDIKDNKFRASQIEIDDTFTTNYGDHEFDSARFPNPVEMLRQLKSMEYQITAWVHPYVNTDSRAFQEGIDKRYFLETTKHSVSGIVRWWQGTGAMIDVFDDRAVEWFKAKLDNLKSLGIDSFKFDGGNACYMPKGMKENPNLIAKRYAEIAASYGDMAQTGITYKTQKMPLFIKMMERNSRWESDNGLKSIIPSVLQLSLLGYNFIIPDSIGGSAMGLAGDRYSFNIPEKELYIRWFQLNTFLQSMQISIAPWQYDIETVNITRDLVKIHQKFVAPRIIELAKHAVKTGEPIIRPLWWIDPEDKNCYDIEDQFLIGNDVLVAPVLEKGVRSRSIYLPHATWKDVATHEQYVGPQWITYSLELDTIPYFIRIHY